MTAIRIATLALLGNLVGAIHLCAEVDRLPDLVENATGTVTSRPVCCHSLCDHEPPQLMRCVCNKVM